MQHYSTVDEDAPTNVSADAKNVVTMTDALPRNADERPNSKQRKPRRSQQPALEHDGRPDEDKDASGECTDVVCAGKNINSNVTTDETCPGNPEVARRKIEPMRFRTRLCRHFLENGTCPFNPNCAFAHGSHELRTLEDNMTISHPSRVGNTYSTPISSVSSLPGALPPLPLPLPPAGYMNASPSAPVYPYPTSYASYHPQAPSTDYINGGSQYPYAYPAMHGSTYSPVYGGYDGYSASAFQYEYTGAPTSTEYNGVSNTGPSLHYHNPYATGMTPTLDTQPLVRSYRLDPYASYPPNFTESNNTDESVQYPAGMFYPSPNSKSLEHAPVPNEPNMHTATYQKYQNAIP